MEAKVTPVKFYLTLRRPQVTVNLFQPRLHFCFSIAVINWTKEKKSFLCAKGQSLPSKQTLAQKGVKDTVVPDVI